MGREVLTPGGCFPGRPGSSRLTFGLVFGLTRKGGFDDPFFGHLETLMYTNGCRFCRSLCNSSMNICENCGKPSSGILRQNFAKCRDDFIGIKDYRSRKAFILISNNFQECNSQVNSGVNRCQACELTECAKDYRLATKIDVPQHVQYRYILSRSQNHTCYVCGTWYSNNEHVCQICGEVTAFPPGAAFSIDSQKRPADQSPANANAELGSKSLNWIPTIVKIRSPSGTYDKCTLFANDRITDHKDMLQALRRYSFPYCAHLRLHN